MVNVSRSSFIHAHIQKTPASSLSIRDNAEAILQNISYQIMAIPPLTGNTAGDCCTVSENAGHF